MCSFLCGDIQQPEAYNPRTRLTAGAVIYSANGYFCKIINIDLVLDCVEVKIVYVEIIEDELQILEIQEDITQFIDIASITKTYDKFKINDNKTVLINREWFIM